MRLGLSCTSFTWPGGDAAIRERFAAAARGGIGAAWNKDEARGLGLPFAPLAERFEMLEEALRIARRMWGGDQSPVRGRHFELERPLNSPRPLSRPHPPILVGGNGERKTLRLVAQYADACNLFEGVDVPHKLKVLRQHCDELGRDYDAIEKTLHFRIEEDHDVDQSFQRCAAWAADGIEHVIAGVPDAAAESWQDHLGTLADRLKKVKTTDGHGDDH